MKSVSVFRAKLTRVSILAAFALTTFALALATAGSANAALSSQNERYEDAQVRFDHPAGWTVAPAQDVSAELALKLDPPSGSGLSSALVLIGAKKIAESELESASAAWHSAHVRNRAAWGMKMSGGLPREPVTIGGRRALRYRDRVGSSLGAADQLFTCTLVGARLCCVLATATPDARPTADALTATVLSSLSLHKK